MRGFLVSLVAALVVSTALAAPALAAPPEGAPPGPAVDPIVQATLNYANCAANAGSAVEHAGCLLKYILEV